jgi:hypothetical protein
LNDPAGSKRGRRALRIIGVGVVGLTALGAGAILTFTHSSIGADWVADKITTGYGEQIAGSVELGRVEGSLAQGIEMGALVLKDRDGRELFSMEQLRLELSLMAAVGGEFRGVDLKIDGVTVTMPSDGEPGFADIRPKPREPKEDRNRDEGREGPSLQAAIALSEIKVVQRPRPDATADEAELLGRLERADLQVRNQGSDGDLTLAMVMQAPAVEQLDVRDFQLAAAWQGERVSLGPIRADTSWGKAELDELSFDPVQKTVSVEKANLAIDSAFFEAQLGVATTRSPTIDASGRLGLQGTDFRLDADLAEGGTVSAQLKQNDSADLLVRYELDASLPMSRWQPSSSLEQVELSGKGKLETIALGTWQIVGDLDCRGCETGSLQGEGAEASAHVDAKFSALQGSALASMQASVAGSELELKLSSGQEGGAKLSGRLATKVHGRFDAWLARLGVERPTHRADALEIDCGGEGIGALACHVMAEGKDLQVNLLELPKGIVRALGVGEGVATPEPEPSAE